MYGICIELKTSCSHCSAPLMLNALTEKFICPSCNNENTFSFERWQGLLEDPLNDVHEFKLGEGQPSTIMSGDYNFNLMYGRQDPRCSKCKQNIDLTKLEEYSSAGHAKCSKCSNLIYVRKPNEGLKAVLPRITYLAGEDEDLISMKKPDGAVSLSGKPVLFTCPSCAGSLEIDGSERMLTCKYCSSQIYLPDDLWFRLHPSDTVMRWYVVYETKSLEEKIPDWYYLSDIAIDKEGNLYAASANDSDRDFIVWSIGPDLKTRWTKYGLKYNYETSGITVTNDGNLYLWDSRKHSLLKLSSKDGEIMQKIEGKPASDDNPYSFDLKGCSSLVSCKDGTILAIINNTFARFSPDGKRIDLWKGKRFGFIPTGIGKKVPADDDEYAPYLKDIHSYPKRVDSDFTKMNITWDDNIYMIDKSSEGGKVAIYNNDGDRLCAFEIPLDDKGCKACIDNRGVIYVVGRTRDSKSRLVRVDPGTGKWETLLTDILEGGVLNDEDQLAVSPTGTVYIMKFYNRIKIFTPDMKMIHISDQCKEDDEEKLKEKKEKIENDEDFS